MTDLARARELRAFRDDLSLTPSEMDEIDKTYDSLIFEVECLRSQLGSVRALVVKALKDDATNIELNVGRDVGLMAVAAAIAVEPPPISVFDLLAILDGSPPT